MEPIAPALLHDLLDNGKWLRRWPVAKQLLILTSINNDPLLPSALKSMVKRELSSFRTCPTKSRLIQAYRNLRTQAAFAPHFYAIQKALTSLGRHYPRPGQRVSVTIGSGFNATSLGGWLTETLALTTGPRTFYERDGKAWDATMQLGHFELTERVYSIFGTPFLTFVRAGYDCKGSVDTDSGRLKYTIKGTRKSGHNDTTLGNNIINAAITYESLTRLGLTGHILVAGDDLLVVLDGDVDCQPLIALESSLGIRPEARAFKSPFSVSFISGCFYGQGPMTSFSFIPRPGRIIERLGWTTSPPSARVHLAYLRGVALGLSPVLGEIPVVRCILAYWRSIDAPPGPRDSRYYVYRDSAPVDFGHDRAPMTWFCARYSLVAADVLDCERLLNAALAASCSVPFFFSHPTITRMISFDSADAPERPPDEFAGWW